MNIFSAFPSVDFLNPLKTATMSIPGEDKLKKLYNSLTGGPLVSKIIKSVKLDQGCMDAVNNAFKGKVTTLNFSPINTACAGGGKSLPMLYSISTVSIPFYTGELSLGIFFTLGPFLILKAYL